MHRRLQAPSRAPGRAAAQRGRDSNPRLTSLPATAFKAVPIGHSGTPPCRRSPGARWGVYSPGRHAVAQPRRPRRGGSQARSRDTRTSPSWTTSPEATLTAPRSRRARRAPGSPSSSTRAAPRCRRPRRVPGLHGHRDHVGHHLRDDVCCPGFTRHGGDATPATARCGGRADTLEQRRGTTRFRPVRGRLLGAPGTMRRGCRRGTRRRGRRGSRAADRSPARTRGEAGLEQSHPRVEQDRRDAGQPSRPERGGPPALATPSAGGDAPSQGGESEQRVERTRYGAEGLARARARTAPESLDHLRRAPPGQRLGVGEGDREQARPPTTTMAPRVPRPWSPAPSR